MACLTNYYLKTDRLWSLIVPTIELTVEVEIDRMSRTLIVALVIDVEDGIDLERVVTEFDPPTAESERNLVDPVVDADGAILAHRAFDPGVEELIESLVAKLKLSQMLRTVLEAGLRTGADAAVYPRVIFALDPEGELGVEFLQAVNPFLGKAEESLKT